jgi:hypothetical protein
MLSAGGTVKHYVLTFLLLFFSSAVCLASDSHDRPTATEPVTVAGKWQVSWQGRLGTLQGTLALHQDDSKLSGTFQDSRNSSLLSGSIEGSNLSFEVQFQGARPYTIEFHGKLDGDKITGTSLAKNVGSEGAFLGHGGEVAQPEHPWTATRQPDSSSPSEKTGDSGKPKN